MWLAFLYTSISEGVPSAFHCVSSVKGPPVPTEYPDRSYRATAEHCEGDFANSHLSSGLL